MVTRSVVIFGLLATASCTSVELAPPRLTARNGAASRRTIRRVVALPTTCGGLINPALPSNQPNVDPAYIPGRCPEQALKGADQAIRSSLDFQGYSVIDSEKVNAVTASRHEIEVRSSFSTSKTIEQHGALFEDATPNEQNDILRELGADGILNTRVFVGSSMGLGMRRTVVVQIRLRAVEDGALAWARRCELEVGGLITDAVAIEQGAKCAIEGAK